MTDKISFGSTFRVPISQSGINAAKKAKLKNLIESYPNGLIGTSKTGSARVSMPDSEDEKFIQKLKSIGYKVFQKFEGEDIKKSKLDAFIKKRLDNRDYAQYGKNRKAGKLKKVLDDFPVEPQREEIVNKPVNKFVPKETETVKKPEINEIKRERKPRIAYEPNAEKREMIRKTSEDYKRYVEEYGKEFAEAVFFGILS